MDITEHIRHKLPNKQHKLYENLHMEPQGMGSQQSKKAVLPGKQEEGLSVSQSYMAAVDPSEWEAVVCQAHPGMFPATGNLVPGGTTYYQSYSAARDSKGRVPLAWSGLLPELPLQLLAPVSPADEARTLGQMGSGPALYKW